MDRPLCLVVAVIIAGAFLHEPAAAADEAAQAEAAKQAASPVHTASPAISSMIAAGLPKYEPGTAKVESDKPAASEGSAEPDAAASKATIVHLPAMIVRDRRLPKESEVMSKAEKARRGMELYIGPENGLDRGVLNLFTFKSLWQRLPFFGRFPLLGFETNEQRGLRLYQEAELREELESLKLLTTVGQRADAAAETKPAGK